MYVGSSHCRVCLVLRAYGFVKKLRRQAAFRGSVYTHSGAEYLLRTLSLQHHLMVRAVYEFVNKTYVCMGCTSRSVLYVLDCILHKASMHA